LRFQQQSVRAATASRRPGERYVGDEEEIMYFVAGDYTWLQLLAVALREGALLLAPLIVAVALVRGRTLLPA
jgi:hypothetical protein